MNYKELLKREKDYLSQYAAKSDAPILIKRQVDEREGCSADENAELRLPFQRDRDRIIHSRAFRRLMHKTQIFNANLGDHYRNRLTHTMEVSQIARSISKYLGLNDELTEAIALGHDLGHTPFGHVGERTLHLLISGNLGNSTNNLNEFNYGGFKHNFQSLQIIDNLEKRTSKYHGLNLSLGVREGILKHTDSKIRIPREVMRTNKLESTKVEVNYSTLDLENIKIDKPSFTLEGQVVGIADEIAQCTHDLEDGIRAKIITKEMIMDDKLINLIIDNKGINWNDLKETVDYRNILIKFMVGDLISDVCTTTKDRLAKIDPKKIPNFTNYDDVYHDQLVDFSEGKKELHKNLSNLITQLVIASQEVTKSDLKAEFIIKKLFDGYYNHPQQLPDYILNRYYKKKGKSVDRLKIEDNIHELKKDPEFIRLICDHIGSMTDQYAAREYKKLYEPEYY
ncbi:deoxyguanosinetriphosphate triphosphohydrolase [Gottschalkiaceae bacterium SANA]|nr:deoxyguanosinetriphosphate triphosphohydrolase [Gottschalkiaceae bacterium SANA]